MNNDLNFYLPNLDDNSTQKYAILMKDKIDNNFDSSVVSNKYLSLEEMIEQYKSLKADNSDEDFYIITEQTARSVANKDKIANDEWIKIINETYAKLGLTTENLLNNDKLIEQKQKDKLEKAKALGLFSEEPLVAPVVIDQYLPKLDDENAPYSFIVKDKNNNDLQQITIDKDVGSLAVVKKIVNALNDNVNDKEYYIVTPQFAADLPNLNNNIIGNVLNQTQELVGNPLRVSVEPPPEVKIEPAVTSREKLSNPGINEILTPDAPEDKPKNAPTPEQINNNYQPIAVQFEHIKQKQTEAKMKKSGISKSMMLTTVGLLGVGMMSIPLAPIALPAAFLIGSAALVKSALFKGDKKEVKKWEKHKELLTEAALDSLGVETKGKKKPNSEQMKAIEKVIFTPEIEEKYQELCRKISLSPSIGDKISNIRHGNNKPNYPRKNNSFK